MKTAFLSTLILLSTSAFVAAPSIANARASGVATPLRRWTPGLIWLCARPPDTSTW